MTDKTKKIVKVSGIASIVAGCVCLALSGGTQDGTMTIVGAAFGLIAVVMQVLK